MSEIPNPFEPSTYFGIWSRTKLDLASNLLNSLGVRYYVTELRESEERLKEWCAWDPNAADPNLGFDLWIHSDDLGLVGSKIVELFPERKFGA